MNAIVVILVMLWIACLGFVLLHLLELDGPVVAHLNAFLDAIFPAPGGDQ